jgi:hypothetical protein
MESQYAAPKLEFEAWPTQPAHHRFVKLARGVRARNIADVSLNKSEPTDLEGGKNVCITITI